MKIGKHATGRTRFRPTFWGTKFILQVEEVYDEVLLGPLPFGTKDKTRWRDARIGDFDLIQPRQPKE